MATFAEGLGSILEQQFNVGENKNNSLDVAINGNIKRYGKLGDFASKFDQSAERRYLEEGFLKQDFYNQKPKTLDILMQEPDITVLVKKRAFSSLSENFRQDLMSNEERLLMKATKILFQNKCKQISNFEKLSKIEKISSEMGRVDYKLLPLLFNITDSLDSVSSSLNANIGQSFTKFKSIVDEVRKVVSLSTENIFTTWVTNNNDSFKSDFGNGTGVIELTNVLDLRTTTSINFNGGQVSLSISDPYEIMRITNIDIEQAIADATNKMLSNNFQLGFELLEQTIQDEKLRLNKARAVRGANPINFIVNPDTFLGKRVRAIVDNSGLEINFDGSIFSGLLDPESKSTNDTVDKSAMYGSDEFGIDGLKSDEGELKNFLSIVSKIFNFMQIQTNSKAQIKNFNETTNPIRKKLRLYYGNKLIIQPMDTIHIFINSKTRIDNKIIGGMQDSFSSIGFMQTVNHTFNDLKDFFIVNNNSSVEKSIFVGSDFPNWMWLLLRNQFVADKSGTQVFSGIIESSEHSFSGGKYSVSVSGKDNSYYFSQGVVNFKPAANVFNGSFYDPLTPFDIKFDSLDGSNGAIDSNGMPSLLDENKALFQSVFLKYKNGLYAGKKPTQNNYISDADRSKNNSVRRVFYDPDGMIYKWKEGIGSLVLFGDSGKDQDSTVGVSALTEDPFAGQDVMNVLSLLITGEPYNFATFYNAAIQNDGFARDPMTGQDSSVSYFKKLQSDLKQRNFMYGSFVPFKKLTIDENSFKNSILNQTNAISFDKDLQDKLKKRAEISDKLLSENSKLAKDINNSVLSNENNQIVAPEVNPDLKNKLDALDQDIDKIKTNIINELNKSNKPINIIGSDISVDQDQFLNDNQSLSNSKTRRELRRKINFLTRRLLWKTKANEDINLFIVDDSYDKDYDIQAFEKSFQNDMKLFDSDYTNVGEKITNIAQLLLLEVFADTQGNIQVRPPQYNRVPSSIFYKMLKTKQETGIQIFPQYLEDLFANQLDNIIQQIEIIEDEIRLLSAYVGFSEDDLVCSFINNSEKLNNNGDVKFKFLTLDNNVFYSRILRTDLRKLIVKNHPEKELEGIKFELKSIQNQSKISNIFDISSRINISRGFSIDIAEKALSTSTSENRINRVSNRLKISTGLGTLPSIPKNNKITNLDVYKISSDIALKISERQKAIKTAAKSIKNLEEGISLSENKNNSANKILFPNLYGNKEVPEMFEHMIEDENYDDYGPGSGQRYIIKDRNIISMTISENQPEYTTVTVKGSFSDQLKADLPPDLNVFQGGNSITSASAMDYDLWRMYGLKIPQPVSIPALTDPKTQCAPYAISLLNRARQNILRGTINIIGNEYMQPGEVIYIENMGLLFYIESVNHNFTYNQNFTTTLNVSYGHNPGEYIPVPTDLIGKVFYKNKEINNILNVRQGDNFNQEHLGTIIGNISRDTQFSTSDDNIINDIINGPYSENNKNELKNIISSAQSALNISSTNYTPKIEVRVYYNTDYIDYAIVNKYTKKMQELILNHIKGIKDLSGSSGKIENKETLKIYGNKIIPVDVDSSLKKNEFRYPSRSAYMLARNALDNIRGSSNKDNIIYNYIVECWLVFEQGSGTANG